MARIPSLVSIITPFFNAEQYLHEAVESVVSQSYANWELLLINDGSTDRSAAVAKSFKNFRIRYFEKPNGGVSSARNIGLKKMRGDYFCFLDADDTMPPQSLESRIKLFYQNPNLEFVDGVVNGFDSEMNRLKHTWCPKFVGNPLADLIRLSGNSFFGPTWMIKKLNNRSYWFKPELTHGEDLLFYIQLASHGGEYNYTREVVLNYRDNPQSAMKNLVGLERGYRRLDVEISKLTSNVYSKIFFSLKWRKIMFLSYLHTKKYRSAFRVVYS
ncbi:MAG: glycosyltransferase family 2 protein [Bacteroidota bacterium]